MKLYSKISQVARRNRALFIAVVLIFCANALASEYRDKGYLYLSPVPRAEYVRPETRFFLVRFEAVSPNDITNLSTFIGVTGAASGAHTGQTWIATDDRTVIFEVSSGFSSDELVTVTLTPTVDPCAVGVVEPYQYQFMVSGPMPYPPPPPMSSISAAREQVVNMHTVPDTEPEAMHTADMKAEEAVSAVALEGPNVMPNGVSVPSDFPHVNVTINNNPAPGHIFLDYRGSPTRYAMILDNSGAPVWYRRGTRARDFKVQKNGIITWTNFQGFDQNFNYLRSFGAVNGYNTDDHELQVQEDGGYLLIGYRRSTVDMSLYVSGGNPNASVSETVIQEFTAASELIFQWRAWDNFDVRDVHLDNILSSSFRFPHMNAIDIDEDGHILLSSRHLSEATKIRYPRTMISPMLMTTNCRDFVTSTIFARRGTDATRSLITGTYIVLRYHEP
ncbi:MAG: aryl-sulfate sulfotransferase [Planctomycetota bacterium]|jgi:hypothetical protein